jgi:hypothetical protein
MGFILFSDKTLSELKKLTRAGICSVVEQSLKIVEILTLVEL